MLTPKEVVAEVVRLRRSSAEDTEKNADYTHNELCDILQERLTDIGDCFQKYDQISYVVQGPRDQGVDVLLKLGSADEAERYVAFQIKSYSEISDKKQELSKNLKVGLHDAISHYGPCLVQYYIIFFGCTAANWKRLTATTAEFAKDPIVRVIDERYARTLLDLDGATVAAIVDNFLRREDIVLKKGKI
ncbi:hypothetical protein KR767_06625 [Luteibacter anthropi]|uniref:hypothetical protein n=1 Tax=Luteibacter anthropi TaxID=564369 RepID=UPI002032B238|nr:hypothetical protein [Luteibacter anthropi]URX63723.1 hypothetical protein KR767_06625 [Luteibacter anthropi]